MLRLVISPELATHIAVVSILAFLLMRRQDNLLLDVRELKRELEVMNRMLIACGARSDSGWMPFSTKRVAHRRAMGHWSVEMVSGIVGAFFAGVIAIIRELRSNRSQIQGVHLSLNSRLDELIEAARASGHAAGVLEGKEQRG